MTNMLLYVKMKASDHRATFAVGHYLEQQKILFSVTSTGADLLHPRVTCRLPQPLHPTGTLNPLAMCSSSQTDWPSWVAALLRQSGRF